MITADKLKQLISLDSEDLADILDDSGYTDCKFHSATFLGMTNGGQFCYSVEYFDDHTGEDDVGKVFVRYDHSVGALTADF